MIRFVVVLAVVALSSPVSAQPAGAQAEVLFREGRDLMTKGKYVEACAAFEQSQKLEPAITTLINLAGCREKAGQLASAWGLFLEAERQTRGATTDATRKFHDLASSRAQKLESRISKLSINVPQKSQVDGLEIMRDNERVEPVMWNRALPIDGGPHTISARAPGANTWSTQVTVAAEGDTKTVEIPDLKNLPRDLTQPKDGKPVTPTPVAATETQDDTDDEDKGAQPSGGGNKRIGIIVGAGAVALLGGAGGFLLWGNAKYDDAKAEMTSQARRDSLYDSANQKRMIAGGLAVAGVATAGVAVWLLVRSGSESSSAVARKRQIVVSPTGIAMTGTF
ncbi:MAG TPA: tetratricopeptide repeat protein [Kofleriaceae bacterium]